MAFKDDFKGFNSAYGEMLNEQMLLNLARLDNGHPAQYLAVGTVQSNYTFNTTGAGGINPTSTDTSTTLSNQTLAPATGLIGTVARALTRTFTDVVGGSATLSAAATSNPQFQWIPLNNEEISKQVLEPMDQNVFYSLYQQGFPIDQLLRVMVERVETTLPSTGSHLILVNSPNRGNAVSEESDGGGHQLTSYERFLRACAMLRIMQIDGDLVLETGTSFEPLAKFTRAVDSGKNGGGNSDFSGTSPTLDPAGAQKPNFQPTPEEVMQADKDNYVWQYDSDGAWELGKYVSVPKFYLKDVNRASVIGRMAKFNARGPGVKVELAAVNNLLDLLEQGISVKTTVTEKGSTATSLILRSFSRAFEATASEQEAFDEIRSETPDFDELVTPLESQPILRTRWTAAQGPTLRPLVKLSYSGKTYQITDLANKSPLDPQGTWNRDVYRLIVALNSQVTVDISKFQSQYLEIRPN